MNGYLNLLLDFQSLPRIRRSSTFMEIAGYPHYENVCSNILGFYFDPDREHGMGNMFLTAFLGLVKERLGDEFPKLEIPKSAIITREYPAEDQKRIDLMIESDRFTIGIENKIYHWEANDFENYVRVIERLGTDKIVIKAVLCLRTKATDPKPQGGFTRYTYPELWKRVRNLLGHYLPAADPKWTTYLNEFMTTTSRLAGETYDEKEVTDFFMQNHEIIERLVTDRQQHLNRLQNRFRSIEANLASSPETTKFLTSRGMCGNDILASHFEIQGKQIGMDLARSHTGWTLMIWQMLPHDVLNLLIESPSMKAEFPAPVRNEDNYTLRQWELHAGELELQEALISCFKALIAAADFISIEIP